MRVRNHVECRHAVGWLRRHRWTDLAPGFFGNAASYMQAYSQLDTSTEGPEPRGFLPSVSQNDVQASTKPVSR